MNVNEGRAGREECARGKYIAAELGCHRAVNAVSVDHRKDADGRATHDRPAIERLPTPAPTYSGVLFLVDRQLCGGRCRWASYGVWRQRSGSGAGVLDDWRPLRAACRQDCWRLAMGFIDTYLP